MSNQADVRSIDALKEFRVALALYAEETLSALGAVEFEAKRTVLWLQQDRRAYWQEQIKRRREQVAAAKAEVFRRKLAKTADYTPAFSEQKELLRQAEASLRDAELRASLVRKWEPALQQAILEYHGSVRRIKDLAAGDIPRALARLERIIDALEAYLRVAPPPGRIEASPLDSIADEIFDDSDLAEAPKAGADEPAEGATPAPPEDPAPAGPAE